MRAGLYLLLFLPGSSLAITPTPTPAINPGVGLEKGGDLVVDLGADLRGPGDKAVKVATIKERLGGLVYAINSVNTTSKKLVTVDDLLKAAFPPEGAVDPEKLDAIKIPTATLLTRTQRNVLAGAILKEPLACATGAVKHTVDPIRADVLTKLLMDRQNYYALLGLNDDRRAFEREQGIAPEFDVDGPKKDLSDDTMRFLIRKGSSGIVHPNVDRLVVMQKTPDGRMVLRTGDINTNEASDPAHNFVQRPATARVNASEEIWELPNGMRAYSARDAAGKLITDVPNNLVTKKIANPTSCMSCHKTGFITNTGEGGSLTDLKDVKVVPEEVEGKEFGNKNLFRSTWKDYDAAIAPANKRFEGALAKSGGSERLLKKTLGGYEAEVPPAQLAAELGTDEAELKALLATKRFRSAWDPDDASKDEIAKGNIPAIPRSVLEQEIDLGRAGGSGKRVKKPLYCALKDFSKEESAAASRGLASDRELVRALRKDGEPRRSH